MREYWLLDWEKKSLSRKTLNGFIVAVMKYYVVNFGTPTYNY